MKNQKGFTLVEGLLIVFVVAIMGFGGWYFWNNNQDENTEQVATTELEVQEQLENNQKPSDEAATVEISQTRYKISLPEGWEEKSNTEAPAGAPELYHEYTNGKGQTVGVSINSGGFGGGGDGSASFVIEGNRFNLENEYDACDPTIDEMGVCRYGDSKLELIVSSAGEHKGDNYTFWLWDKNSEDQNAYSGLKDIIETIELN